MAALHLDDAGGKRKRHAPSRHGEYAEEDEVDDEAPLPKRAPPKEKAPPREKAAPPPKIKLTVIPPAPSSRQRSKA